MEPPGARGILFGAYETDVREVGAEYRRLYRKEWPGIGDRKDQGLALCYYDVPAEQTAVSPPGALGPIERISIVVDGQLNSVLLHGGPRTAVPIRPIG